MTKKCNVGIIFECRYSSQFIGTKAATDAGLVGRLHYGISIFEALDADREMPLTNFRDAFATHRDIAAADRSSAERRPVRLAGIPAD